MLADVDDSMMVRVKNGHFTWQEKEEKTSAKTRSELLEDTATDPDTEPEGTLKLSNIDVEIHQVLKVFV